MKYLILFIISMIIIFITFRTVNAQFQISAGLTNDEYAYSIVQTTDSGYAVAGRTTSFGNVPWDMYVIKFNASGLIQWTKFITTPGGSVAYSIVQTNDGGFAVAGMTEGAILGSADDMYIVKLDANGVLQWARAIGGSLSSDAYSIIQTSDGGYAVAGWTSSFGAGMFDMYIVKLNAAGLLQWSKTVGGTNNDYAYSIVQTPDGGYGVAGSTVSYGSGNGDILILKLSNIGNIQWSRTVGGTNDEAAYSIIRTTDGGFAMAGFSSSFGGGKDMYIVKIDSSGTLQWTKDIGGTNIDNAFSIIQTADGGYAAAGYTFSFGAGNGNADMYIVKLNAVGLLQWSKTIGGTGDDRAYSIIQTIDGGYAMAGYTNSFGAGGMDFYIVKLDVNGNTCGNTSSPVSLVYSSSSSLTTSPSPTVTTPSTIDTLTVNQTGAGGILSTICVIGIKPISNEIPVLFKLSQNYPNPFNPTTNIEFSVSKSSFVKLNVYDITGKEIETLVNQQLNPGTYKADWNAYQFASGVYFYRLTSGDFAETKKMVLIK